MKLFVALLISALIVGCEPSTKPSEKIEKTPEPKTPANETQISAPAKPLLDFSYSYHKNLYTRKDAGATGPKTSYFKISFDLSTVRTVGG